MLLRHGEAEDAEIGEAAHDVERNVFVLQMPFVRVRNDFRLREFEHLLADRFHRLVEAGIAEGRRQMRVVDERREAGAVFDRVALRDQPLDRGAAALRDGVGGKSEIRRAHELALVHRNAAKDLREIFAEANARQQVFGLAESARLAHAPRIGGHLADRLHISREPGEAMHRMLLGLHLRGRQRALLRDAQPHGGDRIEMQRLDIGHGGIGVGEPVGTLCGGFGGAEVMGVIRTDRPASSRTAGCERDR